MPATVPPVTRFAPSPNGHLHLGHALSAIVAHDLARGAKGNGGGRFLLRIEDIDGPRSRPELAEEFRRDLAWLGLEWDEVPGCRPEAFTLDTVPARFAERGDPWTPMDDGTGSLESLLGLAEELGPPEPAPKGGKPLIEVARTKTREEAMAALEVWRERHRDAAALLQPADVLVDGMRGPSSIWYRIRINLEHVPPDRRPGQEDLISDYSPWEGYSGHQMKRGPE